jgi:hypothetical protein
MVGHSGDVMIIVRITTPQGKTVSSFVGADDTFAWDSLEEFAERLHRVGHRLHLTRAGSVHELHTLGAIVRDLENTQKALG